MLPTEIIESNSLDRHVLPRDRRETVALALLLAATFLIRAIHPAQPIVENYVGRQVPTAMVARNLARGSGFLHPELDTGPFPNRFLVEPPIYAQAVAALHRWAGVPLVPAGRLASALAITVGAWGLYGLARRREGPAVGLLAVAAFAVFPVMVRYGRAFQPDALMLGASLVGLRGWDEWRATGLRGWLAVGGVGLTLALAVKVIVAWVLLPWAVLVAGRWPAQRQVVVAAAMLVPAAAWYALAWGEIRRPGAGSLASADNAAAWLGSAGPAGWLRPGTWSSVARNLVVGAFGPVGFALAVGGWWAGGPVDRMWRAWGLGLALAVLGLAAKWHHGYYWMTVAPVAAVGVGRALVALGRFGPAVPGIAALLFAANAVAQSTATWRTPPEWAALPEIARVIAARTAADETIIAPEAVLFAADRRGFRLEFDPAAARRAAGEWGEALPGPAGPLTLTDFYQSRAGDPPAPRCVADSGPVAGDPARAAWRAAIRARPDAEILLDRPDGFVARIP